MKRSWLVPEVIQSSGMDCGPAALKSLLEGFGIDASYGRLREACQTDVDGTSIDTLEEIAIQLGLQAEQVLIPYDHLLLKDIEMLPALTVTTLPNGFTHFVVVWRCFGPWVQIMDPGRGRRWVSKQSLQQDLYKHSMVFPASDWREWAASEDFLQPLRIRLKALGLRPEMITRWLENAIADKGHVGLARLDATTRMLQALQSSDALKSGVETEQFMQGILGEVSPNSNTLIPQQFWSVQTLEGEHEEELEVSYRGAVVVRINGVQPQTGENISSGLRSVLQEKPPQPIHDLWQTLKQDGLFNPALLCASITLSALLAIIEPMLFRSLLDLPVELQLFEQRLTALLVLFSFLLLALGLEIKLLTLIQGLGRRLEIRFRLAFLEKLPKLPDQYFHSRLNSDMAERAHAIHLLRDFGYSARQALGASISILFTVGGIIWLVPIAATWTITFSLLSIIIPIVALPLLNERDLRARNHIGALSRFYLDALNGLIAIRSHGSEAALEQEHESLTTEWGRSEFQLLNVAVAMEGIQSSVGVLLAAGILYLAQDSSPGVLLLLTYWALSLPLLSQTLAGAIRNYPIYRNTLLRIQEPMQSPEISDVEPEPASNDQSAVSIQLNSVSVISAGHPVLKNIDINIAAGEHIAIVGPSGAGKSSLVGILLGWLKIAAGEVHIDGQVVQPQELARLRSSVVWLDPSVQLWNRSLLENLYYGSEQHANPLSEAIETAELDAILQTLALGLQTPIGENGRLLSGGEGQRIRFGRGILRPHTRLVILDEAFRGLDREVRNKLLARARKTWPQATLLCITHDIEATLQFPRVIVLENGQIREDDCPRKLSMSDSRFQQLLEAEQKLRSTLWQGKDWREFVLKQGQVTETIDHE